MKRNLFEKVLFVGTDTRMQGGVASVLKTYRRMIPGFRQLRTNSVRGMVPGLVRFALTLASLPFFRLFSGREILHVHGSCYRSFARKSLVIRFGKLLGFRTILHIHGGAFREFAAKTGHARVRSVLDRCDAVVCLSESWKSYFAGELGCCNVVVVPNVIDSPERSPRDRKDGDKVVFVFLGAVRREKGIFDLVDVIAADTGFYRSRCEFLIGGTGDTASLSEKIEKNGVGDCVRLLGWVDGGEKKDLLDRADALVLPSYTEALPICILEAMAYGLTIVSTRVGAIPEVVADGENGILYEPGDNKALDAALRRVINDPVFREKAGAVSEKLVLAYLPDGVLSRLKGLYESLG